MTWEDQISLFPGSNHVRERIGPPEAHVSATVDRRFMPLDYGEALSRDVYDLPGTAAREGYYGEKHFDYWLSGLQDSTDLLRVCKEFEGRRPDRYLDFGGASGRVARHMALAHEVPEVMITDINREHVNFVVDVFCGRIRAFQHSSIPYLPLEPQSFDLISAYSVFSHIETFDDMWIVELRRLLSPNGVLALTAHIDNLHRVDQTWPLYRALVNHPNFDTSLIGTPLQSGRIVVRWSDEKSYSSHVFLSEEYVRARWAPWFAEIKIIHGLLPFQTMVLLRR